MSLHNYVSDNNLKLCNRLRICHETNYRFQLNAEAAFLQSLNFTRVQLHVFQDRVHKIETRLELLRQSRAKK